MSRSITFRQLAAVGVAAVGIEAVLSAATPNTPGRQRIIDSLAPAAVPSVAHVLALIGGLALLVLAPKLWRGTRTAASLAIAGLLILAVLNVIKGLDYDEAALDLSLAVVLAAGRRAFPLGCRNRPRLAAVGGAVLAWALVYCALLIGPFTSDHGHTIKHVLHHTIPASLHAALRRAPLNPTWATVVEGLIGSAVLISVLAVRSLLRPVAALNRHAGHEYRNAREIVERFGEDSLSPFTLRPDKALYFASDGVLAYHVIGETAIVSGDPIAPRGLEPHVLASFQHAARARGWELVVWGASARHLDAYRRLGLRSLCAGEEAVVDPAAFTLEGRNVRKLRQSVHRLERRGWSVLVREARGIDADLEAEIDAVEAAWRARQPRILGFAMSMGRWDPELRPSDLYLLARAPEGDLRAFTRFAEHCGRLSLDTMRRLDGTPNGVNEALICHALDYAGEHGVPEVSLNYAGLAHLLLGPAEHRRSSRVLVQMLTRVLGRRFQLTRLVRFNQKFQPEWRPRFLIYESSASLPRAATRVLQAEGYLPQRRPQRSRRTGAAARALRGSPQTDAAR
jgi:lysyl-tRNA synthetase, class II